MQLEDVKKLARLARIDMSNDEMVEIANDFDSILAYVGQVQEISKIQTVTKEEKADSVINVMREDIVTNQPNEYTEKILKEMPDSQDGFLKVKQIL